MQTPFLPFSRPSITAADIASVTDALTSGWITTGPRAAEFERLIAERLGCEHVVTLTSATAAMQLLLHAMNIGPGDEVITPSLTWVSTVNQICLCGATPVFVDVDQDSLMTTAALVEPRITERTRLVIPVHYAGAALDIDSLRRLGERHGVSIVEDAAHALGTFVDGGPIGGTGTALFSLHPIKNITTAEGGILCTDDAELAERVRRLRFHGLGVDAFDRETQGRAPQTEVIEPGFKQNLPDLNAALGISQLARLDDMNERRAALAERYLRAFGAVDSIRPLASAREGTKHSWHLFIVRLVGDDTMLDRDSLMTELKARGIGTGLHFRAVHTQRYYRETFPDSLGSLPHTEWNSERILSLPLFPDMTDHEQDRVIEAITDIIERRKAHA